MLLVQLDQLAPERVRGHLGAGARPPGPAAAGRCVAGRCPLSRPASTSPPLGSHSAMITCDGQLRVRASAAVVTPGDAAGGDQREDRHQGFLLVTTRAMPPAAASLARSGPLPTATSRSTTCKPSWSGPRADGLDAPAMDSPRHGRDLAARRPVGAETTIAGRPGARPLRRQLGGLERQRDEHLVRRGGSDVVRLRGGQQGARPQAGAATRPRTWCSCRAGITCTRAPPRPRWCSDRRR